MSESMNLQKRIAADAHEEDAFIKRARDWYCQRRTWKARYKSASPCVKKYFDFTFAHGFGSIVPSEREAYAKITESIMQKLQALYEMFTDAEWDEAIAISGCRQGLMRARVKYQKKSM